MKESACCNNQLLDRHTHFYKESFNLEYIKHDMPINEINTKTFYTESKWNMEAHRNARNVRQFGVIGFWNPPDMGMKVGDK